MAILSALGDLGRPGISIISPAMATTNPAPALNCRSLIVSLKPLGAPKRFGLSLNEYWVLAMQTGKLP